MSLITDALKAAQRERASQTKAAKGAPPVSDGFFPYVSNTPAKARARRTPIVLLTSAVVVILAGTAWLMRSALTKPPTLTRPPIILPPPVTVTQTPAAPDTAAVASTATDSSTVASNGVGTVAASDAQAAVSRTQEKKVASRPQARRVEPVGSSAAPATVASNAAESTSRAPTIRGIAQAPRADYEAEATALFNAGDLAGARDRFQLATRTAPTARAWTNYGVTLQRLGDVIGASAAYQAAIGIDANYLEAWLYQGRLAADRGDVTNAVPLLQRARAINPRNADVNVELARLEYESGNFTEAKRFAEEAARSDPANTRANWYIGVASDTLRDTPSAIRGFTAYLQYIGAAEREQAPFVGWARQRLAALRGKP